MALICSISFSNPSAATKAFRGTDVTQRRRGRGEETHFSAVSAPLRELELCTMCASPDCLQCRVPCGNRTRLSSLEGWCLSRSASPTRKPGVSVTPGFCKKSRDFDGRVSQAPVAHGERIRRLTGKVPRAFLFANVARPQGHHFWLLLVNAATKAVAWLLAVLVPIRPRSPGPVLHVGQHPQGSLQAGLAKLFLDLVRNFIEAGLPLVFDFGK